MVKHLAVGRLAVVALLVCTVIAVAPVPASAVPFCTSRYVGVTDVDRVEGGPPGGELLTFHVWSYGCAAATVKFQTIGGPIWVPGAATPIADYVPVSGTLTWNLGDTTSRQVTVQLVGESLVELDETLSLRLSDPHGAMVNDPVGKGTIINDDELIIDVIPDGKPHDSCSEANESCGARVVASAVASFDVTVHFATRDGTALAGQDYAPVQDRIVTIPAGSTWARTWVVIFADGIPEPEEFFYVNISQPSAGRIGDGEAQLTIWSS
jgi:Calx-beta domain